MTTTDVTIKNLAEWIDSLKGFAEGDHELLVSWFKGTKDMPFCIVGGWMKGFSESYTDLLCVSKSQPEYAMCVKIAVNEGPYAYADFESLPMPSDGHGTIDDTCIALEQGDDSESLATFLLCEFERIMAEHTV